MSTFTEKDIWNAPLSSFKNFSLDSVKKMFLKTYKENGGIKNLTTKTMVYAMRDLLPKDVKHRKVTKSKYDKIPQLCELRNFINEIKCNGDIDDDASKKLNWKIINLLRKYQTNIPTLK